MSDEKLQSTAADPGAPEPVSERAARPTVVGIGASAGGLAALKALFASLPERSGIVYVVVVHLNPEHRSHLADLLQPLVRMPVQQVTETVPLERDHVYVIAPGANLEAVDSHLRLSRLAAHPADRAPIDHFFRTLAATHDGHSVGVILTGTGSDGSLGIKAIKEVGGLTLAQDPAEAEFDGMPRSAIETGAIDLVLPLERIADAVHRFDATTPRVAVPGDGDAPAPDERQLLQKIFGQIRARTGRDFTRYKPSTILRRIGRRMQIRQVEDPAAYVALLRDDADEVRHLADDLLINVTNFFRDAEAWQRLADEVIPQLFEDKAPQESVRVWSVGCATGEEVYTLAMLLVEEAARREHAAPIQLFASDLHERSLERAREGFYPGDIEVDVSAERLRRHFHREEGGYRVRKELRELVVFAPHNLLADPPFSRLDLIACRNLLIYLQRDVQQEVFELFHYALRPGGFLVLGSSETVDGSELFQTVDKRHCIHRKRNVRAREPRLPVFPVVRVTGGGAPPRAAEPPPEPVSHRALHAQLVEQFAPPSMLVAPDGRVAHLSRDAGRFLVHPAGEPTTSAFKLVREELRMELRAALHAAREGRRPVRTEPVAVRIDGHLVPVALEVRFAPDPADEGFALVVFEELPEPAPLPSGAGEHADGTARLPQLEAELELTRQRLQAIVEEFETSQEEMRASHEELQSANEELRSTMEELETSREELQSMNEELQTVNQENRHKVEELSQLSSDLQNLLVSTEIATLFLDRELRILRFTPQVGELFNVRPVDRGRPISDLTHRLGYPELRDDALSVLRRLIPVEREVRDERGRWYLTRVLPYRDGQDRIIGVVVTFVDITARRRAEDEVGEARVYAESIVETLHEPLLVLHPDLRVRSANQAFYDHFGVNRAETEGRLVYHLGNGQWDIPALRTLLEDVLPDNNVFKDFEVRHEFEEIGERVMLVNARRLDHVQLVLLGIRDITGRARAEAALRESEARYRTLFEAMDEAYTVVDLIADETGEWVDFRFVEVNPAFAAHTGMEHAVGRTATELLGTPNPRWAEIYGRVADTGEPVRLEEHELTLGRVFDLYAFRLGGAGTSRVAVLFTDVTERKQYQERQAFLLELSDALRPLADPVEIQSEAVRVLGRRLGAGRAAYAEVEADGAYFTVHRDYTDGVPSFAGRHRLESYGPEFWADLRAGRTISVADAERDARISEAERAPYAAGMVRAAVGVPLVKDERLAAVLFLHFPAPREWPDADVALVEDVADRTWAAIERARAEAALRESEQQLAAIFAQASVGLCELDAEGSFLRVNDALCRILGRPCEALLGMRAIDVTHPDDIGPTIGAARQVLATGAPVTLGKRYLTPDDGVVRAESSVSRLDRSTGVATLLVVTLDVTARHAAEAELRELNETLERRVEARTAELTEAIEARRQVLQRLVTAEENERRRISRELHDQMAQSMTALLLRLKTLESQVADPAIAARLAELEELADRVAREMQQVAVRLRPPALDNLGLAEALRGHLDEWSARTGIDTDFHATGFDGERLPPEVETTLYRVVQEGLTNVVKHAGATHVNLSMERRRGAIRLALEDDGRGFEVDPVLASRDKAERLGVRGMRERVALLGGEIEVESAPGSGTTLFVRVPDAPPAPQSDAAEGGEP